MRPRAGIIAIVFSLAVMLGGAGTALAHVTKYDTSIRAKARPPGPVDPGTEVNIEGKLSSGRGQCARSSEVVLKVRGGGTVDTDRTDTNGRFRFVATVDEDTTFVVRFAGKVLAAQHPHTHTCAKSVDRVSVAVT